MALQRDTYYPGRYSTGDAAHPQGAFKNRTTPTSQDGSYLEQDWLNDWDGFFASLLDEAGTTPDDSIDEVGASQYYDSLINVIKSQTSGSITNGNIRIPFNDGGTMRTLIIQWGFVSKVSAGSKTFNTSAVTFPVTFPNALIRAFASPYGFSNNDQNYWFKCDTEVYSASGMSIVYATDATNTTTAQLINWIAIGY